MKNVSTGNDINSCRFAPMRILQNGQVLSDRVFVYRGGAMISGRIGNVLCFTVIYAGDPKHPLRGRKLTPRNFDGPATVQLLAEDGSVIDTLGLATREQVAEHPQCADIAGGCVPQVSS